MTSSLKYGYSYFKTLLGYGRLEPGTFGYTPGYQSPNHYCNYHHCFHRQPAPKRSPNFNKHNPCGKTLKDNNGTDECDYDAWIRHVREHGTNVDDAKALADLRQTVTPISKLPLFETYGNACQKKSTFKKTLTTSLFGYKTKTDEKLDATHHPPQPSPYQRSNSQTYQRTDSLPHQGLGSTYQRPDSSTYPRPDSTYHPRPDSAFTSPTVYRVATDDVPAHDTKLSSIIRMNKSTPIDGHGDLSTRSNPSLTHQPTPNYVPSIYSDMDNEQCNVSASLKLTCQPPIFNDAVALVVKGLCYLALAYVAVTVLALVFCFFSHCPGCRSSTICPRWLYSLVSFYTGSPPADYGQAYSVLAPVLGF